MIRKRKLEEPKDAHKRDVEALCESALCLDLVEDSLIYPSCFHILFHQPLW